MRSIIKLIAIVSYKNRLQKHSIILGFIHLINPITNSLIVITLGVLKIKLYTAGIVLLTVGFHSTLAFVLYKNYSWLIKDIDRNELKKISTKAREWYSLLYIILILICIFIAIMLAGYGQKIVRFITDTIYL
jgi:hypothetical protein